MRHCIWAKISCRMCMDMSIGPISFLKKARQHWFLFRILALGLTEDIWCDWAWTFNYFEFLLKMRHCIWAKISCHMCMDMSIGPIGFLKNKRQHWFLFRILALGVTEDIWCDQHEHSITLNFCIKWDIAFWQKSVVACLWTWV